MDFFTRILEMTLISGCAGLFLMKIGKENMLGVVGAFALLGAIGGLLLLGFMCALLVYSTVSNATFALLGLVCSAPFILGPVYLIYRLTVRGNSREYDGRGYDDGDGSN
jgi:hypothetical protein